MRIGETEFNDELAHRVLCDDDSGLGGTSHLGEELSEFIQSSGELQDAPLWQVNKALSESGIYPITLVPEDIKEPVWVSIYNCSSAPFNEYENHNGNYEYAKYILLTSVREGGLMPLVVITKNNTILNFTADGGPIFSYKMLNINKTMLTPVEVHGDDVMEEIAYLCRCNDEDRKSENSLYADFLTYCVESIGGSADIEEGRIEVNYHNGQDCRAEFDMNDFWNDIERYLDNYDLDYETYFWLGEDGHGRNGAPYHIKDIIASNEDWLEWLEELQKLTKIEI